MRAAEERYDAPTHPDIFHLPIPPPIQYHWEGGRGEKKGGLEKDREMMASPCD